MYSTALNTLPLFNSMLNHKVHIFVLARKICTCGLLGCGNGWSWPVTVSVLKITAKCLALHTKVHKVYYKPLNWECM